MKLTNNEISNALIAFNKIGEIELEAKTAYALYKTIKALEPHSEIFNKIRNDLIKKYSKEEKGIVMNSPEYVAFFEELAPILNDEIEVAIEPVDIPSDIKLTLQDIASLDKLINLV